MGGHTRARLGNNQDDLKFLCMNYYTSMPHVLCVAQQYHPRCFLAVEPQVVNFGTDLLVQSQIHLVFCDGVSADGSSKHHSPADAYAHMKSFLIDAMTNKKSVVVCIPHSTTKAQLV